MNLAATGQAIPPEKGGPAWPPPGPTDRLLLLSPINATALSKMVQKPNSRLGCQAAWEGVDVYGACSLSQVVHLLRGDIDLDPVRSTNGWPDLGSNEQDLDFGEVNGQQQVKRAVERAGRIIVVVLPTFRHPGRKD